MVDNQIAVLSSGREGRFLQKTGCDHWSSSQMCPHPVCSRPCFSIIQDVDGVGRCEFFRGPILRRVAKAGRRSFGTSTGMHAGFRDCVILHFFLVDMKQEYVFFFNSYVLYSAIAQDALEISKSQSRQFQQQWDEFLVIWNHIDDQYQKPFRVAIEANSARYVSLKENTKNSMDTMTAAVAIESLNKDQMNAIFNLSFKVLDTLNPVQTATLFSYYPGRTPNVVFLSKLLSRWFIIANKDESRAPFDQFMEAKLTLS